MTSQAMTSQSKISSFSKAPSEKKSPPCYESPNTKSISYLKLHTPQATEQDKSMDSQDKIWKIINRLSTLDDLFTFYWYAHNKADFQKESIEGIFSILGDCITELKEAVNEVHTFKQ
ncbi:MAG: hypothetical protein FWD87_04015 [Spirochaetaceae bacterium]|nr:hypothetical protein [Spirochaetaceae bacterium]